MSVTSYDWTFFLSLTFSSHTYLLSTQSVPITVLGTEDITVDATGPVPAIMQPAVYGETETMNEQ